MPIDYKHYPPDWHAISRRIRFERAANRCEWCGAANRQPHPVTGSMVVLTVAHWPDDEPMNCADENLHALCQRCHNRLDAPARAANRARTLAARKAKQQLAFDWQA